MSMYGSLSEEFIEKHKYDLNWTYIAINQKLSEKFFYKNIGRIKNYKCIEHNYHKIYNQGRIHCHRVYVKNYAIMFGSYDIINKNYSILFSEVI
jgi:hypothetical protein